MLTTTRSMTDRTVGRSAAREDADELRIIGWWERREQVGYPIRVAQVIGDAVHHQLLEVAGGRADASRGAAAANEGSRDIVAIAPAAAERVGRREPVAVGVEDEPGQEGCVLAAIGRRGLAWR
jgi:hypothetical protein